MADYTFTVYELQTNNFDFGLNDYKIFDESYRTILNNAILEFYKFREIGYQNPYQWRDRMRQRLDLIMRNKYNELYKAKQIEFNPLFNVDMKEVYTHEITNNENVAGTTTQSNTSTIATNGTNKNTNAVNGKVTDTNNESNNRLSLTSSFPSEEMTEDNLTSALYVDSASKNKETNTSTQVTDDITTTTDNGENTSNQINSGNGSLNNSNTTNGTMIETYTRKTDGSSAGLPFSRAMQQLKDYLDDFQLDQQVIGELHDLFMTVW